MSSIDYGKKDVQIFMFDDKNVQNKVIFIKDVPDTYDDLFVCGIGMIESEFYEVHEHIYAATGNKDNMVVLPCIEVMLSTQPKEIGKWRK